MAGERILLGVVGRPHGVRGLVHVHSYTAEPEALAEYGPLVDGDGRGWTLSWRQAGVAELRDADGRAVADRSAAERLVNLQLFVSRDRLPAAGEDEFYLADLVGMDVVGPGGAAVGRVALVHDYGAGTSLEIVREGAAPLLVPFTRAAVPEVDVAARRLVVVPPDEVEARELPAADAEVRA
ncbi:MAG: ribosome maturation factor RimM [Janthinobacterium lividum]